MNDRVKKVLFLCIAPLLCLAALGLSLLRLDAAAVARVAAGDGMTVTFLDVGQADAALVAVDGQTMLIDGGNVADSQLIVSSLERRGISHLDVVVCTHAHEDHVGGLAAALSRCSADHVLCPVKSYDSKAFQDFVRYAVMRGRTIEIPQADAAFQLGGATVTVLAPRDLSLTGNDSSIVLRIDYGATSFLFMGDAGREVERSLIEANCPLAATVLKIGHHGSGSGTSYPFLREVMPSFAVISVGEDNKYGFPDETVLSRLSDAETTVYRTDLCGTITCRSDGRTVTFLTEKDGTAVEAAVPTPEGTLYIGNIGSMKFHRTTCRSLPTERNRIYFTSREDAVTRGFTPCGACKP